MVQLLVLPWACTAVSAVSRVAAARSFSRLKPILSISKVISKDNEICQKCKQQQDRTYIRPERAFIVSSRRSLGAN